MSLGLLTRAWSGWRRVIRASCGRRRVVGIADQGLVSVSWGLLTRASSGWRRVFGIAD